MPGILPLAEQVRRPHVLPAILLMYGVTAMAGYSIEKTLSNPAFWDGAADARAELFQQNRSDRTARGIVRCQDIAAGLRAGKPLTSIAAYGSWLASGRSR